MEKMPLTFRVDFVNAGENERLRYLDEFAAAGAENIVLCEEYLTMIMHSSSPAAAAEKIRREVSCRGLVFCDAHSPFGQELDLSTVDPDLRKKLIPFHQECLKIAADFGVKTMTIHVGKCYDAETSVDRLCELTDEALAQILPVAEKCGVTVCIENIWYPINTPERLLRHCENFKTPYLGLCFDSGHANIMGNPTADPSSRAVAGWGAAGMAVQWDKNVLEKMLGEIVNCHLHDNNGITDQHLMAGHGTVDWEKCMTSLAHAPRLQVLQCEVIYPRRENIAFPADICAGFRKLREIFYAAR